ncbi:replicative DNA helicase [Variovorax paradoxus]|uniref:replicative DNA helicase n=1 Tax=Variovorax paradoxus TaxID=34073 RepID=UPI00277E5BC4|nr:replicative DNA helicase [Variovorax paradoxus]MDQ0590994.1 replicative DNA helicase [Variovorax paradoxus]
MNARADYSALETEQAILGGLLLDNRAWDRVGDLLRPEHFTLALHRVVFAELARQIGGGQPADVVTVSAALGECASMAEIHALASYLPGNASLHRYAGILIDRHRSRELLAASGEVADIAQQHDTPIDERIDTAQAALAKLTPDAPRDEWIGAYEGMLQHTQVLEDRAAGSSTSMPTGLRDLDESLNGGLPPGSLVVVGARPGMGKTSLGLTIGLHMAEQRPVAMLSMEMSHSDIRDRQTAMLGRVSLSSVLRPSKGAGLEWDRVIDGTERAKHLQFYVSDQGGLNINQVRAKARAIKRQRGLSVLIVDYLGLMVGLDPKQNRAYQLEEVSRGLKTLAKELDIAVILLAQLNRDVEKRADQTPMPSDLRDSGAIEQDADVILLIYRPIQAKPDLGDEWKHYAKLRIGKARQGRTGDVNLSYIGEQTRFEDWIGSPPARAGKSTSSGSFE